MNKTKIEWTDATWNPITGCTPVSEGCKNCYAAGIAKRFWGDRKFSDVQFHIDRLDQPLRWRKPRKVFVCSMSDLFHEQIPEKFVWDVLTVIVDAKKHIFQILTKRPERMNDIMNRFYTYAGEQPHVWLGVTAENQKTADERIPILLDIPAAVRFVSVEPMLSDIDLKLHSYAQSGNMHSTRRVFLNWIIAGTESGPKRRPAKTEWIRSLKDQCVKAGIPFFLKQREIDGKVVKMPLLDGKKWAEMPK